MKMIQLIYFTMMLLTPQTIQAQNNLVIQAHLMNAQNQAIAYANIGIVGTNTGTISAPDGSFSLYLKGGIDEEQIVRISHLGYETKDFTIASLFLLNKTVITLEESAIALPPVEVRPIGTTSKIMGHKKTNTRLGTNFSIGKKPNQNLGSAIGKKFKLGKKEVFLKNFQFYITHNNFDTVRFRVEISTLKNGRPHKSISTQEIIKEITEVQKGWVSIDLSPYHVYAKGNIAIAITWIYHAGKGSRLQLPNTIPVVGATHYYRYGSQSKWKRFRGMSTAMQLEVIY